MSSAKLTPREREHAEGLIERAQSDLEGVIFELVADRAKLYALARSVMDFAKGGKQGNPYMHKCVKLADNLLNGADWKVEFD